MEMVRTHLNSDIVGKITRVKILFFSCVVAFQSSCTGSSEKHAYDMSESIIKKIAKEVEEEKISLSETSNYENVIKDFCDIQTDSFSKEMNCKLYEKVKNKQREYYTELAKHSSFLGDISNNGKFFISPLILSDDESYGLQYFEYDDSKDKTTLILHIYYKRKKVIWK